MAYRHDIDLEFLDRVKHDDLKKLAYILTHDPKDNETRWTQELTKELAGVNDYHSRWREIAGELQCYGANTLVTFLRRGKGVEYREILLDVCEKCEVEIKNKKAHVGDIESQLLARNASKIWEKLPSDVKKELSLNLLLLDPKNKEARRSALAIAAGGATAAMFYTLLTPTIGTVMAPLVASQVSGVVGSLSLSAMYGVGAAGLFQTGVSIIATRIPLATIPGMNLISLFPAINSLAGPAYRVTIPACICIADLRKKKEVSVSQILEVEKWKKIVEALLEELQKYKNKEAFLLANFVFACKVLDEILDRIDDDTIEDVKSIIYGAGSEVYFNVNEINYAIKNNDFNSAYKQALGAGASEKFLKEVLLVAICQLADKSDQYHILLEKLN